MSQARAVILIRRVFRDCPPATRRASNTRLRAVKSKGPPAKMTSTNRIKKETSLVRGSSLNGSAVLRLKCGSSIAQSGQTLQNRRRIGIDFTIRKIAFVSPVSNEFGYSPNPIINSFLAVKFSFDMNPFFCMFNAL